MTPAERVAAIEAEATGSDLNSWEKFNFLPSIKRCYSLKPNQERTLKEIEDRIFGSDDD